MTLAGLLARLRRSAAARCVRPPGLPSVILAFACLCLPAAGSPAPERVALAENSAPLATWTQVFTLGPWAMPSGAVYVNADANGYSLALARPADPSGGQTRLVAGRLDAQGAMVWLREYAPGAGANWYGLIGVTALLPAGVNGFALGTAPCINHGGPCSAGGGVMLALGPAGDVQSTTHFAGATLGDVPIQALLPGTGGGYLAAGSGTYQAQGTWHPAGSLTRLKYSGEPTWSFRFPAASTITQLAALPDGSYVALGPLATSDVVGPVHVWLGRVTDGGQPLWQSSLSSTCCSDYASALVVTVDGDIVAGGMQFAADGRGWLFKMNSDGTLVWQKTYGSGLSVIYGLAPAGDGGIVAVGLSAQGSSVVARLDAQGEPLWARALPGAIPLLAVNATGDGGWIAAGLSVDDTDRLLVVKLDAEGNAGSCPSQSVPWFVSAASAAATLASAGSEPLTLPLTLAGAPILAQSVDAAASGCPAGWSRVCLPLLRR